MTGPRPLRTADEAVARALALVDRGVYELGTGDLPSTGDDTRDCFGFAVCECYGIKRHRPGFNGGWYEAPSTEHPQGRSPSVTDDLNCNSAIDDADHHGDLFERVTTPFPGALILYPTIRLQGHARPWIGHVKLVTSVSRCCEWNHDAPDWSLLDTVECAGPNGRRPGIVAGTGATMAAHDRIWPKPEHRTVMLRVRP